MADKNSGITKSMIYLPDDPPIAVWTRLQLPPTKEFDTNQWNELFQPLVHTVGHDKTVWARVPDNPNVILLATLWWTTSELHEFEVSPSFQLYQENLQHEGIIPLSIHKTIYGFDDWFPSLQYAFVQIFWVYFPAPVDESLQSRASKLVGIYPSPLGPGVPKSRRQQMHVPVLQWATEPEVLHGKQVQLLLWPHLWSSEKHAEWRHQPYAQKRFLERVAELGPVEWKEEIYDFTQVPRL